MRISILAKTNIFISLIMFIGFFIFLITYASIYYDKDLINQKNNAEKSMYYIYGKISDYFLKPLSVSHAMAENNLFISYLTHKSVNNSDEYNDIITKYLNGYKKFYRINGALLYLIDSNSFFSQEGLVENSDDIELINRWFKKSLTSKKDYDLNIDYDKSTTSFNNPSLFINYKIKDQKNLLGFVGVSLKLEDIMDFFKEYEEKENKFIYLLNENGIIQISSTITALNNSNWYEIDENKKFKKIIKNLKDNYVENKNGELIYGSKLSETYLSIKYIPRLDWYLVIENVTQNTYENFKFTVLGTVLLLIVVLIIIILCITSLIKKYERKIKNTTKEKLHYFHDAAIYLETSIYKIDLTLDKFAPESRLHQFNAIRNEPENSYSESLKKLADLAIIEKFRPKFLQTFSRENILANFANGIDNLTLDCIAFINNSFEWLRYTVEVFQLEPDENIHMYIYAKNVTKEYEDKLSSQTDGLTKCLTKTAFEEKVDYSLRLNKKQEWVFYLVNMDNLKLANDNFGHAFGDLGIKEFAQNLKRSFRKDEIIGRVGGDEFAVFLPCPSESFAYKKAGQIIEVLHQDFVSGQASLKMSASVGVAFAPSQGTSFGQLYRKAQAALFKAKAEGKNKFCVFSEDAFGNINQNLKEN